MLQLIMNILHAPKIHSALQRNHHIEEIYL